MSLYRKGADSLTLALVSCKCPVNAKWQKQNLLIKVHVHVVTETKSILVSVPTFTKVHIISPDRFHSGQYADFYIFVLSYKWSAIDPKMDTYFRLETGSLNGGYTLI